MHLVQSQLKSLCVHHLRRSLYTRWEWALLSLSTCQIRIYKTLQRRWTHFVRLILFAVVFLCSLWNIISYLHEEYAEYTTDSYIYVSYATRTKSIQFSLYSMTNTHNKIRSDLKYYPFLQHIQYIYMHTY